MVVPSSDPFFGAPRPVGRSVFSHEEQFNHNAPAVALAAHVAAGDPHTGYVLESAHEAAWTAYTPVLTAVSVNPTLGVASIATARYTRIGKTVHYMFKLQFGTSGTAAGTGNYRISLPVNSHWGTSLGNSQPLGDVFLYDASANNTARMQALTQGAGTVEMFYTATAPIGTLTAVTHAVPWAWTINDAIVGILTYESV